MNTLNITAAEHEMLVDDGQGMCRVCAEVHDDIEPGAEHLDCNSCANPEVFGAESLVLLLDVTIDGTTHVERYEAAERAKAATEATEELAKEPTT